MLSNIQESLPNRLTTGNPFIIQIIIVLSILGLLAPAILLLLTGRFIPAAVYISGLFAVSAIFYPRFCFWLFFLSIAIHLRLPPDMIMIQPYDIAFAMLFVASILDFFLNNKYQVRPAFFDIRFFLLIAVTILSAVFAYSPSVSIIPVARIIIIYFAFRFSYKFAMEIGVEKILQWYLRLVVLLSVYNIFMYALYSGTVRIFGPAWLTYETYAMTALPVAVAFMIWSRKGSERLLYALMAILIGFGIFATESRAPLLAVLTAIPATVIVSRFKSRRDSAVAPRKKMKAILIPAIVLVTVLFVLRGTILSGAIERYENFIASLLNPDGTIALRLILWSAAWKAFLSDPLTGIGIGNFKLIAEIFPEVQLSLLWKRVANMSAHNVILQYLAETGLVGALALLALATKGISVARKSLRVATDNNQSKISVSLFVIMFIFITTLFYMRDWTWGQGGYLMALYFGLCAAHYQSLLNNKTEKVIHK